MKAARVHRLGTEPVLDDAPAPEPGPGETLVELEAAAVGHLDLTIASGHFPLHPPVPYVPGTDASGRVLRSAVHPEGAPVWIRGGGVGVIQNGCWSERAVVPDEAVHLLPDGVDPVLAATFFVPCSTARVAVEDVGAMQAGERVAVRGAAGAVGSVAVQLALRGGAREVLGIVRRRREVPAGAIVVGADEVGGVGDVDLLIDTVGGPGLSEFVEAMSPGGRIVLVGYVAGTAVTLELPRLLAQDVRLLPANQIRREEALFEAAPGLLELLLAGELVLPTTAFPFERLHEALDALRAGRARGRVALTFA